MMVSRRSTLAAILAAMVTGGCVGTAMTTDPDSGATVPVQGWRTNTWHDDPAWRPFGSIGKKEWRQGPWWYGDPAWQFLTVGQGGRPELSKPGAVTQSPPAETPAASAPADSAEKPAGN